MMTQNANDKLLNNWSGALQSTVEGRNAIATRTAEKFKESGYSADETYDLMIAENYNAHAIESAIKVAFKIEGKKEVVAEYKPLVVPTCYEDVKPIVEKTLSSCTAKDFINKLASTEYSIIPSCPDKKKLSLIRIAEDAKRDAYALRILHEELLPFVENKMYESIVEAQQQVGKFTVSETTNTRYIVASSVKIANDVCLETGACSCDKYTKGNYADFGIACEHLVSVCNAVNPNHKMVRGEVD
jgi:predicted nucleic acid-binding Zn finger protein